MACTVGILIAGGEGARLGLGLPKARAVLGGRTLLDRAGSVLRAVCDEILVVAPAAMSLSLAGGIAVDDPPGAVGPLGALVTGLATRPRARALVLGVDFPLMRPATLAAIRDRLGDAPAAVPVPRGVPQPLAAAYAPGLAGTLAEQLARGERSVTAAVLGLGPLLLDDRILDGFEGGLEAFFNLNTRDDLAAAERRLAAGGAGIPGAPA
jgi:molybdopterin-guanine dinucleotide biosynthesis protein A